MLSTRASERESGKLEAAMRLEAFQPTRTRPWDERAAAHLARRAGFGANGDELRELVELGLDGAVARFVDFPDGDPELDKEIAAQGGALGAMEADASDARLVARARLLWTYRLACARHPLREKLALFWHDHFATSESKVLRVGQLAPQIELFRTDGAGRFGALLSKLARDPAMLVYLDNRTSKKDHPNENWSRELMELFTLGVGHYTQRDVHEIARAFTGWSTPERSSGIFVYQAGDHDTNDKEVLGNTIRGRDGDAGMEEGEEVLAILAKHPACAQRLARKLCERFVAHDAPEGIVHAVAAELTLSDLSIRDTLRALFRSDAFHHPDLHFALYKNPVEYAVSAIRALGVRNVHLFDLPERLTRMGMRLFEPPSVAGWPPGRAWIQSSYLIERFDFALALSELPHTSRKVAGATAIDFDAIVPDSDGAELSQLVDALSQRLLQRRLRDSERQTLVDYARGASAGPGGGRVFDRPRRETVRGLVQLVLSTPEFSFA
jgi:uncharacterized protein (DUF1800 family)